jgi:hypothetical protein
MAKKDSIFYWLKLKAEFMGGDIVDFLMSQKNGANYVVLYQMLCLKTINTKGELATQLGDILVPYDIEKIQRDLKWFDIDTVRVALELYKRLGLVYVQENGIIKISNIEDMVGSETYWAQIKREQRSLLEEGKETVGNCPTNVQNPLISNIYTLISNIFNYWNSKNIMVHKALNDDMENAIKKALKKYSEEEIKTYIDRYAEVFHDKEYWWHYKWSITEFLTRKDGISSFADEGTKWANYCEWKSRKGANNGEFGRGVNGDTQGTQTELVGYYV